jgi:CheY-like chemotaxis protein
MTNAMNQPIILVAEDDKLYARVYESKLTKEGYAVTVVGNGTEALKKAKELQPNLMLLDLIMPEMDGFEVLKKIKEDTTTSKIRVVVMSNLGQESDIARAKDLGAEEYFVKSNVSITDLMTKIRTYAGEGVKIAPPVDTTASPTPVSP